MLIYRRWQEFAKAPGKSPPSKWDCDGWFLFGLIPLYIRRIEYVRS